MLIIGLLVITGEATALPDWITVNGSQMTFTTDTGNTIVYRQGHLTDFFYNGTSYGGLSGGDHTLRGYRLIEGYYFGPNKVSVASCQDRRADLSQMIYADDSVAVIQAGCSKNLLDQELWRYVISRHQSGFYEMQRKNLTGYLEAQNDQDVQFLNTSVLRLSFSSRGGGIVSSSGYVPLFTQFSQPGMPFTWEGGYDPVRNVSLGFIQVGSDQLCRTTHRRYFVTGPEQQLDFCGAGEGVTTQMPRGATWLETWSGIVPGNATELRKKALSLVGPLVDEPIIPFVSTAIGTGGLTASTGTLVYQPSPKLNYDMPYSSGNSQLISEYPYVNNIPADKGNNTVYFEAPWNTTYRNPDVSAAWMTYSIGNGSYNITSKRTAYRDADGIEWTFNVTAAVSGNMTFSVNYQRPTTFRVNTSGDNNMFSLSTMDPIEGDSMITFVFPEPVTVRTTGTLSTVSLKTRNMSLGNTTSFTIYAIPHKSNTPASAASFHTREKTILKIPYRMLHAGLAWMPNDKVTAYDCNRTGSGYNVSAFAEAGTHLLDMRTADRIYSISTDRGVVSYTQDFNGTIRARWKVENSTVGTLFLSTVPPASPPRPGPIVGFTVNVSTGYSPMGVRFTERSPGATTWNWSFGDGEWLNTTKVYQKNPEHRYPEIGSYTVSLMACNVSGCNVTDPGQKITVMTLPPPTAKFSINITSGRAPLTAWFVDTSGASPAMWNWSFGDGTGFNTTYASQKNPVHTYTAPGKYFPTMIACNSAGCNATVVNRTITVS